MDKKSDCDCEYDHKKWWKYSRPWHRGGIGGHLYGLGFIGALFYFLQNATTFGAVVLGILKAIFWPALIVFKVLEILKF